MKVTKWFLICLLLAALLAAWFWVVPPRAHAYACTSRTSGNWSAAGTWTGCNGTVPQNGDDVTIASGHTVTVNTNTNNLNSLTVNRTLTVGNNATGRTVTVNGNVTIANGGSIAPGTTNATHSMVIGGNLTNDGTFDGRPTSGRVINVTFNNTSADQTISGTNPTRTRFSKITLDKGASSRKITASINVSISGGADSVTWTNGTWEQTARTVSFTSGNQTLTTNGNLTINNAGSLSFANSFIVTGGTFTVDTSGTATISGSGNRLEINGGTVELKSGTVNVGGRIGPSSGGGVISSGTLRIQGATVNVPAASLSNSTTGVFMIGTGATFEMSSGTLNIKQANQGSYTGNDIQIGVGTITGGETVIGSSSPGTQDFLIRVDVSVYRLTINTSGLTVQLQTSALTVNENLTISAGILDANNLNITIGGNWTNNGTFTPGTGTVTFNGTSEQTISGSSVTAFNNLTVNSGATVVMPTTNTPTVAGTLTNNGAPKQTQSVSGSSNIEFLNISTNKYYGVMINPGGNNLGSTTVTAYGNQMCSSMPELGKDPIKRCFYIEPTTQLAATVRLYYLTSELNGNNASTLNIYHEKDGLWYLEGGTYTREADGGTYDWVQVTGVDEYSPFTAGNHGLTLVELVSFTATPHAGYVLLEWETASEIDNDGFNLWRSETEAGPYAKLNADLIPARGGPTTGASYSYVDEAIAYGDTYWYKLEDVDLYGVSTFHGPLSATPHQLHWLYLPLLLKGDHP